ncbi:MAG: lipopolysaccharide biosynthesis protein RfbH [bacterium]|nr:lipopolysaccharide biosynthesis protein RfbH [bacterium]
MKRSRKLNSAVEKKIRNKIIKEIKIFYQARKSRENFIPGKTLVNYAGRQYDEREMANLVDASLDFWLTAGRYAQKFEQKLADFLGVKYTLLTNSGSSANLLAISALTSPLLKEKQLKPGDEVITTACGFPTTLNPILQNNLMPVFIDVDPGTYNIKTELLTKALTKKTKAIFVPHTLGNPVNVEAILKFAKKHDLWFVEDNCDALGSKYKGKFTGTFGHIATFSFYPAHHITMGEGGALATNDPLLRRLILSFRDWGRDCWCDPGHDDTCQRRFSWQLGKLPFGYDHKYTYSHIGYNLKVTDMQAAIGVAQLEKLPDFISARRKNFAFLSKLFKKYESYFILPRPCGQSEPSWFGFPLMVRENAPFVRADIVNHLEENRIATRMLFGGNLTKQPAYADMKYRVVGKLANTDLVMNSLFWIGVYPGITAEKLRYTAKVVAEFMRAII